jgi:hypothetical protein
MLTTSLPTARHVSSDAAATTCSTPHGVPLDQPFAGRTILESVSGFLDRALR